MDYIYMVIIIGKDSSSSEELRSFNSYAFDDEAEAKKQCDLLAQYLKDNGYKISANEQVECNNLRFFFRATAIHVDPRFCKVALVRQKVNKKATKQNRHLEYRSFIVGE